LSPVYIRTGVELQNNNPVYEPEPIQTVALQKKSGYNRSQLQTKGPVMTQYLKHVFTWIRASLPGMALIWVSALTVHGATVDDPKLMTVLSKSDRTALKQAAGHRDTGILVTDDQGRVLFSQNPQIPYVPASTLKIFTSLAALSQWGELYRFTTLAGYDPDNRVLYMKGLGDPLFLSEAIQDFSRQMTKATRMREVNKIVIDQSYFSPDISIPGTGHSLNPYDATTGALCANFNTIHFTWDAAVRAFVSAEPQTPLLQMFIPDIRNTGLEQGRILLDPGLRLRYPGLLMAYFLKEQGVTVTGPVETGSFPALDTITLTSPWTLAEVVEKLLRYSNNFMANQVMLALGGHRYGPPATLEKGVRALTDCATDLPGWKTAKIAEGSGISRQNRVTPSQMGALLKAFMPFHTLLPRTDTQYYKTGTLTGIRTRAGYFIGTDHRLYPFVIMGSVPYF
jgi:D-alanyl-D-alanine carboxypeptidase/D-alanyl-D-alanine-endopeptidase (penicillin-binding protein 4)